MRIWKLTIEHIWESHYTGKGYRLGAGFDVTIRAFRVLWRNKILIRVLTEIKIDVENEWLEKLKEKLYENNRNNGRRKRRSR